METEMTPIGASETFRFRCGPDRACFNECCHDLNQFLTPYDILRIKNQLGIASDEFLRRHAEVYEGPRTGLPVVSLRQDRATGRACPFLSPEGCRIYAHRPSACRFYPIARFLSRDRNTGRLTEGFALIREAHCRGFEDGPERRVSEWVADQGLADYIRENDRLMEIIALRNRMAPGPLGLAGRRLFELALYDLDNFRRQVFEDGLMDGAAAEQWNPEADLEKARTDDAVLLRLGFDLVRQRLLGLGEGAGGEGCIDKKCGRNEGGRAAGGAL